jgi:hypothetical protein
MKNLIFILLACNFLYSTTETNNIIKKYFLTYKPYNQNIYKVFENSKKLFSYEIKSNECPNSGCYEVIYKSEYIVKVNKVFNTRKNDKNKPVEYIYNSKEEIVQVNLNLPKPFHSSKVYISHEKNKKTYTIFRDDLLDTIVIDDYKNGVLSKSTTYNNDYKLIKYSLGYLDNDVYKYTDYDENNNTIGVSELLLEDSPKIKLGYQ